MDIKTLIEYLQPVVGLFGEHPFIKAILILAVAFGFAKSLAFFMAKIIGKAVKRSSNRMDDAIVTLLRLPLFWTVILVGILAATVVLNPPAAALGAVQSLVATTVIIIWSMFVLRLLRILLRGMSARANLHALIRPQTLPLFDNIALVLVISLALYLVFQSWNIDMTAWLASAGIVGIAVGFAAKDTLANLFSGVFILADGPYKIGDYVVLENGMRGKVTNIGIRSTRLLTRDDVEVTIPNSIIGNTSVINESGGPHEKFRIAVKVSVAYGSDIDQVRKVLESVARADSSVCADPEPRVRFRTFGASGLDFELLVWVENPELRGRALDVLNSQVYKRFMSEGIEIPYSKHDLYIKQMPPPTELRREEDQT